MKVVIFVLNGSRCSGSLSLVTFSSFDLKQIQDILVEVARNIAIDLSLLAKYLQMMFFLDEPMSFRRTFIKLSQILLDIL
jgi:hypothetical protein